jgi:hypothetical protein
MIPMSLKTVALEFLNTAKDDAILAFLPPLGVAAAATAANPTAINAAAQLAKLNVSVLAAIPDLELQLAQLLAGEVNIAISALVAGAQADQTNSTLGVAGIQANQAPQSASGAAIPKAGA